MTQAQANVLADIVVKARIKRGLSTRELAEQLGVAKGWVNGLESGRFLDPASDRLADLAEVLRIEPARLDRIAKGLVADGLPEPRPYFRAKLDLTAEQAAKVERYIARLRNEP